MYESVFGQIGAGRISILPFKKRSDCESKQYLDVLNCVDGVFMTGGDQVRLTELLNDTSVARSLRERNAHGVHIAGTSAGASAMSSAMIAGGRSGATPRAGMVELAPGFGLIDRFVIDQHFSQRDRLGRLLTAVASIPFGAGIGLDEDTAAFIGPDNTLEVVGSGSVTIIDGAVLRNASGASIDHGQAVGLTGVQLHILVDGNKYDLANHTLVSLGLGAKSRLTHDATTLLT
jgi:cyanophycinase